MIKLNNAIKKSTLFTHWTFNDFLNIKGQIYRQVKNRQTLEFEHQQQKFFIKRYQGTPLSEILKELLQCRLPVIGAKKEWQAIQHLNRLNIPTMTWIATGEEGKNPLTQKSFLVTEALQDTISLEDYCDQWKAKRPSFKTKKKLIEQVAQTAKHFHDNGLNHRDFYLCHFLLKQDSLTEPNPTLYLIDLHRVQKRSKVPLRWRVKDIGSLYFSAMDYGLTRTDQARFIKTYTGEALKSALKDKQLWKKVTTRAKALYHNRREE